MFEMGEPWQSILDRLSLQGVGRIKYMNSEEELIRCLAHASFTKELSEWICATLNDTSSCKSSAEASLLRERGNVCFRSKDYRKSLIEYNKSIQFAPVGSKELSLSYANRSATLFHLELYENCLKDIKRAFESGYPLFLHYKLYQRRAECLLKLGNVTEGIKEYNKALQALEKSNDLSVEKKVITHGAIENSMKAAESCQEREARVQDCTNFDSAPLPSPAYGTSEDFPSASRAVIVKECKEKGRFVITQRDIEVGDIIFVERPFASVLLPEFYDRRCHHCCERLSTPVPCNKCTIPLYCNEVCRDDSWQKYHKWECYGGLNVAHAVGIAHLGLRVTLTAGTLKEHRLFSRLPGKKDSYSAVYDLLTHLSGMSVDDRIAYTLTAVCLTLYLKNHTNYFTSTTNTESTVWFSDDHIFIGAVILRHICQLVCNGHAIVDLENLENDGTDVEDVSQVRIATAIYPSASMMNHSCDPNIINSFYGLYLIVKASKNIPSGQEVFNCYGPNYRTMSRRDRQDALKTQYSFMCTCEKCSSPSEFQDRFKALKCPECEGALVKTKDVDWNYVCLDCKHHPEIATSKRLWGLAEEAHDLFAKASELLKSGSAKDALREYKKCYKIQKQSLYSFHEELRGCLHCMAKCYFLTGKTRKCVDYYRQTLPAVSQQFGSCSLEMANELQTLTDVMIRDILERQKYGAENIKKDCEVALQNVLQAKNILNLFSGPWSLSLQDIISKEEFLKDLMQK